MTGKPSRPYGLTVSYLGKDRVQLTVAPRTHDYREAVVWFEFSDEAELCRQVAAWISHRPDITPLTELTPVMQRGPKPPAEQVRTLRVACATLAGHSVDVLDTFAGLAHKPEKGIYSKDKD